MQTYQIYQIRESGRVSGVSISLLLGSDHEALEAAKQMVTDLSGAWISQGDRLVGALAPKFLLRAVEIVQTEGAEAFLMGLPRTVNPCVPRGILWAAWERGWDETLKYRG